MTHKDRRSGRLCPFKMGNPGKCVGARCMAWRWMDVHETTSVHPEESMEILKETAEGTNQSEALAATFGYCGVAGMESRIFPAPPEKKGPFGWEN